MLGKRITSIALAAINGDTVWYAWSTVARSLRDNVNRCRPCRRQRSRLSPCPRRGGF
jgi:hypothetical protein